MPRQQVTDRQAKPGAARAAAATGFEQAFEHRFRNPGALIGDGDAQLVVHQFEANFYLGASRAGLNRVFDEVARDEAEE